MPLALLSNDDGIGSYYLRVLAEALSEHFEVLVAAPKCEQSWIGRAMSRRRPVEVAECTVAGCRAFSIDGTPCDCVNIAMQHLLAGRRPDIVVSGINIGYNAGIPFILSSGTLGAAIEGAVWKCRALAASQKVPQKFFQILHKENKSVPSEVEGDIRAAAAHAARYAARLVETPVEPYVVHNLNYPERVTATTPTEETLPSAMEPQGLFTMENGVCHFDFHSGEPIPNPHARTDQACMADGTISHGLLDFSRIGRL